jgi:hypothetical protein
MKADSPATGDSRANEGAASVTAAGPNRSVGIRVDLPFEQDAMRG